MKLTFTLPSLFAVAMLLAPMAGLGQSAGATADGNAAAGAMPALAVPAVASPETESRNVRLTMGFRLVPVGGGSKVILTTLIPQSVPGRQYVEKIVYSHKPSEVFVAGGNAYATFTFASLDEALDLKITANMQLFRYDLSAARAGVASLAGSQDENLPGYLTAERYIECDQPEVRTLAAKADGAGDIETVEALYDSVIRTLRVSGYQIEDGGALAAVRERQGDCTEHSDLLVALCRSRGIPARVCEGLITDYSDVPRHAWVEVFTREHGWVPFDPAQGRSGNGSFERLKPMYIYLSKVRNDPQLGNGHSWYCHYWGKPVSITDNIRIEKVRPTQHLAAAK